MPTRSWHQDNSSRSFQSFYFKRSVYPAHPINAQLDVNLGKLECKSTFTCCVSQIIFALYCKRTPQPLVILIPWKDVDSLQQCLGRYVSKQNPNWWWDPRLPRRMLCKSSHYQCPSYLPVQFCLIQISLTALSGISPIHWDSSGLISTGSISKHKDKLRTMMSIFCPVLEL